ncbi:MAG TPA: DegT/DnrJ/EryC1/StrS family aminotransferase, partial [Solirubrobacteraceae bacterium]|nr:DegT/DnrJ/EryC1/StrS family aminotransferase [Solirubrobacteraceae bacterium]
ASAPPSAGTASAGGASVPLTRLDFADPELLEELLGAVRGVAERGAFTLGEPVEEFEREFAEYCETDDAVGVSSGTEALALALRALEIGPGDEVIVPTNSFIATAEAVSAVGAKPRLVDVDPESHLLTAEIVAENLGPNVRCVIPVHLFGATVELDPIMDLARDHGIHVVEDACQAHGARYRGRRVGSFGAFGCFSFYPTKNLGAWGDGGAVTTSVPELAERVRLLRAHGERPRYRHRLIGTTARLDALQAAVLRRKLARLEDGNTERRRLGAALREALKAGSSEAGAAEPIEIAGLSEAETERADHVYHLFVVRTERRDQLREHLTGRGVASAIHYPTPIHRTEAYAELGLGPGSLPVAERQAERMCSLPLFGGMTDAELEQVVEAVLTFTQARRPDER